jgi:antitoxin component YwqK of YwqJK toxin-antitoxin module
MTLDAMSNNDTWTKNLDPTLESIQRLCEKYSNDEKYVFKTCNNKPHTSYHEYIVVMEKCKDTITNEDRKDIVDKNYAKYRANKLNVVEIFSVINLSSKDYVVNSWSDSKLLRYEIGKIVECDKFDENLDKVCSGGIHYFKTIIPAYYHCAKPEKGHSKYMDWYENGRQKYEINYYNGILNGFWKTWNNNDGKSLSVEGEYQCGKRIGKWIERYRGGQIKSHSIYKYEKLEYEKIVCEYTEYYENDQKRRQGVYENNKKVGTWSSWDSHGVLL